jgi:diguanylate cyclase (GGDEF)-like protein/PAS domain S-box-containing protein
VLDVMVLIMLCRLAAWHPRRWPALAWWSLLAGAVAHLGAEFTHIITVGPEAEQVNPGLASLHALAFLGIGGAAVHPAMARLTERRTTDPSGLTSGRAVVLGLTLLAASGTVALATIEEGGVPLWSVMAIAMATSLFVTVRLVGLARDATRAAEWDRRRERRFESLVSNTADVIVVLDQQGRVLYVSPSVRSLGYDPNDVLGEQVTTYLHPADLPTMIAAFEDIAERPGGAIDVRYRVRHLDGSYRWMESHVANLVDDPSVEGLVVTERDITERLAVDQRLRARATQQAAVAAFGHRALEGAPAHELASDAVRVVRSVLDVASCQLWAEADDEDGLVLEADDGVAVGEVGRTLAPAGHRSLAGYTLDAGGGVVTSENLGTEERFTTSRPGRGLRFSSAMAAAVSGRAVGRAVLVVESLDPRSFTTDDIAFVQNIANGLALATARRGAEEETRRQALHDALTELPNRALFLDRLHTALARADRHGRLVAVLFLDLDHFKVVNDSLGHDVGDRLLMIVADRLRSQLRPGDTVARFGGDEFTILCEDLDDTDEVVAMAERILDELREPMRIGPAEMHTTASIGIAVSDDRARPESMLRDADAAMYRAKERGRARHELFDTPMRERAIDRLRTESALRRAVPAGELCLHYQPVVELMTGEAIGVESLLRWHHPTRGLLAPSDFVPVAEETGLIDAIGAWVLEEACTEAVRWHQQPGLADLMVSVNVSARALSTVGFDAQVARVLNRTGIDPSLVCLEITESAVMGNVEVSLRALRRLKHVGVTIAVDDFGTGYSSLTYLRRLPVDVLKVDQSFVAGLGRQSEDSAIVRAVVTLAGSLGLVAIAEGVERAEQVEELYAVGCRLGQGFHYAPPVPASELLASSPFVARLGKVVRNGAVAAVVNEPGRSHPNGDGEVIRPVAGPLPAGPALGTAPTDPTTTARTGPS